MRSPYPRVAGVTLAAVALVVEAGCSVYRAIDETLDAWPRYEIPGSRTSVALPMAPRFTTEALPASPCGDLQRTSFAVDGTFARYSGHFIAVPPACAGHEAGMRLLVVPTAGREWRRVSSEDLPASAEQAGGVESVYVRREPPAMFRVVRVLRSKDGLLGVVAEATEGPIEREDSAKFFRWVRARP